MTRFLLDTNVISDVVRNPRGQAARRLRFSAADEVGTSIVVRGEILYGLAKNASVRGREALDAILGSIPVWPLEAPTEEVYGRLRNEMRLQGDGIDANDLWIASHALALDAVMVTNDEIFSRVPGLKVENWLR
ncbi:type II toxin-antitoxin system VapC family toxin [Rhizobium sp. 2MFCol3.1]|uniref:type II toxin-antitoxin system VapC family toxin n=1 Tax=Rhizobium sp. 2MFCol3.1 TaxID=1246459 RepID=UPI00037165B1|nr:type II toxin-antitoxin system VapC family toxin [Rhizobium sp. 2MFCol3.1]